jgi:hypothetical protein
MTHAPKRLEEQIGADVPAEELERLARVDALLRAAAALECPARLREAASLLVLARRGEQ